MQQIQVLLHVRNYNVFTVLGIISHLDVILSQWEDVSMSQTNITPFYIRNLITRGFWYLQGALEQIPHRCQRMAVHWAFGERDLLMIKWNWCIPPIGFPVFCFLRNLVEMRVVLFSITAHQTTPIKTLIIDLSIILCWAIWTGFIGMAHFRSTWAAGLIHVFPVVTFMPAVPGCLTIAEGDGGAGLCVLLTTHLVSLNDFCGGEAPKAARATFIPLLPFYWSKLTQSHDQVQRQCVGKIWSTKPCMSWGHTHVSGFVFSWTPSSSALPVSFLLSASLPPYLMI